MAPTPHPPGVRNVRPTKQGPTAVLSPRTSNPRADSVEHRPNTFGPLLRQHRLAAGLSQKALAERYGYSIFDSLIIGAALDAGARTLYSEDMQDGQAIDGLTIRNPFSR